MKTYKILKALSLIYVIFILGCDDFLTTPPKDEFSEKTFYTTPENIELSINAIYNNLGGEYPLKELKEFGSKLELGGDLFVYLQAQVYEKSYQGIRDANLTINYIPDIDFMGQEDKKTKLLAEARALRAYFYYTLSVYLGPVVMVNEPMGYEEFYELERPTDIEVTRKFIRDELLACIPDLPSRGDTENGRITKDFARYILAQVYMLDKNWTQAEKYLEDIIRSQDYSLMDDYKMICSYDTKGSVCDAFEYNKESIFEVSYIEGFEQYSHGFFDEMTPQPCSGYSYRIERIKFAWNNYKRIFNNEYRVDTFVVNEYDMWIDRENGKMVEANPGETVQKPTYKDDPRRVHSIITYGDEMICVEDPNVYLVMDETNTTKNGPDFLLRKYWPTSSVANAGKRGRNYIMLRYAKVLLDYAEVQYRLGNINKAYDYLNMVRGRAWAGYPESDWKRSSASNLYPGSDWNVYVKQPLMAKGYDKFFIDLIQEYLLEFSTEGVTTELMMRWENRADLSLYIGDKDPSDIKSNQPYFGWPIDDISENPKIWQNEGF